MLSPQKSFCYRIGGDTCSVYDWAAVGYVGVYSNNFAVLIDNFSSYPERLNNERIELHGATEIAIDSLEIYRQEFHSYLPAHRKV